MSYCKASLNFIKSIIVKGGFDASNEDNNINRYLKQGTFSNREIAMRIVETIIHKRQQKKGEKNV